MKIQTEIYNKQISLLPDNGKHIIGHQVEDYIVVYQAYKPEIAEAAVKNQCLGGGGFSYDRMSWIKPGFLWMMYRCGWATKEDQESVLALWIKKEDFKTILAQAVPSTFKPKQYKDIEHWKTELKRKDVRLQWDPDHDPYGRKQERKAIQIGLKGTMLENFGRLYIRQIDDITDFVTEQRLLLNNHKIEALRIPVETIMEIDNQSLAEHIGMRRD